MTPDELLSLALAGFKQLKAETATNSEAMAVLQIINMLFMYEGTNAQA